MVGDNKVVPSFFNPLLQRFELPTLKAISSFPSTSVPFPLSREHKILAVWVLLGSKKSSHPVSFRGTVKIVITAISTSCFHEFMETTFMKYYLSRGRFPLFAMASTEMIRVSFCFWLQTTRFKCRRSPNSSGQRTHNKKKNGGWAKKDAHWLSNSELVMTWRT